jgi:ESCRT-II complex subunit VPS36
MFEASTVVHTSNANDDVLWTPMDCCIGAALTESGLLQRTPTEVELYTAISTHIHSNDGTTGSSDGGVKCTIELRSVSGGNDTSDLSGTGNIGSSSMVPLTMEGNVDTTKPAMHYRDRTYFPFQITITTHRIVFFRDRNTKREARYIHMSNVFSISTESFYFKSPKIVLSTSMGELVFAFLKGSQFTTNSNGGATINPVKLRDEIFTSLMNSYAQKQWDIDDAMEKQRLMQRKMITTTKVGVDAILSHSQQRHEHAKRITDRAFEKSTTDPRNYNNTTNSSMIHKHKKNASSSSDHLETFLMEATELVQVIQKYVATLDRSVSNHESNDNDDTDKLVHMLQDMGMTSILNKSNNTHTKQKRKKNNDSSSSDTYYYDTIARQVVDLIRPKLQRQTVPMMTLTDVYCIYNRSRGTQLISPEDLLWAMERLDDLQLSLSLLTFPNSGLKVVQDPTRTNIKTLTETFRRMCQQNEDEYNNNKKKNNIENTPDSSTTYYGYITALSVSQQCHIPTILAFEQLQMVEQSVMPETGKSPLVRDETLEVTRFYPNVFF